jgi:hypothetical protein
VVAAEDSLNTGASTRAVSPSLLIEQERLVAATDARTAA